MFHERKQACGLLEIKIEDLESKYPKVIPDYFPYSFFVQDPGVRPGDESDLNAAVCMDAKEQHLPRTGTRKSRTNEMNPCPDPRPCRHFSVVH
ncbi:MAG: hypothetical protein GY710_01455 [Desulfobacteraceae bacterium]|nr:hypothetical protein [Desulfobacteraceae bacterium]